MDIIKNQFKEVIKYSQNIQNPKVDKLFDLWYKAKSKFIKNFGGELTYTHPNKITFELDERAKLEKIDRFISSLESDWGNNELADFVYAMRKSFFNNLTDSDYVFNDIYIKKGTKLVKAFKYFEFNPNTLEEIQNEASRIIQEDKVDGYLTLSVHPLDFLSASENAHNWRSCHALDGDYRAGNLSYMTDSCTVMCYLSSNKKEKLPNFPFEWNSKKWRMWLFVSNDDTMVFAGRQYPFFSESALNIVKDTLMDVLMNKEETPWNIEYKWSKWYKDYIKSFRREGETSSRALAVSYVPVGDRLVGKEDLIVYNAPSLFFNDIIDSSSYVPYYCYRQEDWVFFSGTGQTSAAKTKFEMGGIVPCLCCEEEILTHTNSMLCDKCDNDEGSYCAYCDRWVHDLTRVVIDGVILCPDCAENCSSICDECGELHLNENMIFDEATRTNVCKWCDER